VSLQESFPRQIQQYAILRLIGTGGMGVVYLARHADLGRLVALKVLPGMAFNNRQAAARLLREARIGASISHPGVCQILDAGQSGGDFFYVMEYLEGQTLDRWLAGGSALPVRQACDYAFQLFEVLQFLAGRRIVHRDIKPSNLMICPNDRLKLLDLGLAKELNQSAYSVLTAEGMVMGTPVYMAPEQAENAARVTPSADVYGAGVTLFEMLTGGRPFAGPPYQVLADKLTKLAPDPRSYRPGLPHDLAILVCRLLAREPLERPDHDEILSTLAVWRAETSGPSLKRPVGMGRVEGETIAPTEATAQGVDTLVPSPEVGEERQQPWIERNWLQRLGRWLASRTGHLAFWVARRLRRAGHESRVPSAPGRPPLPPSRPPVPASPSGDDSDGSDDSLSCLRPLTQVLQSIEVAREHNDKLDADELLNWLPVEDGQPRVGNYVLEERIGLRSAVNTYRAHHILTQVPSIVRILPLAFSQLAPQKLKELLSQRGVLMQITAFSPYLGRLIDFGRIDLTGGNFRKVYYTVEDYLPGSSLEQIVGFGGLHGVPEAKNGLAQAIQGLLTLHERQILHGNLHSGKLFLDAKDFRLRICDLSHARVADRAPGESEGGGVRNWSAPDVDWLGENSPKRRPYLAPENLDEDRPPGPACEQYALGVIFVECLAGRPIRTDANDLRLFRYVREDLEDLLPSISKKSSKLGCILQRMVHVNPDRRYPDLRVVMDELAKVRNAPRTRQSRTQSGATPAAAPPVTPRASWSEPPPPQPSAPEPGYPASVIYQAAAGSTIAKSDIDELVRILATQSRLRPGGPKIFFPELVERADLPDEWVDTLSTLWESSPDVAAKKLVKWAVGKGTNRSDPQFSTLGSLLYALLPDLGLETSSYVVALVRRYGLLQAGALRERLLAAYQVPRRAEGLFDRPVDLGPDLSWFGPEQEAIELQGWLPKHPELLDVGFLRRAIEKAASICRVELPHPTRRGTGFLINPRLLLTCFHVLKAEPGDDLEANARSAILRFGCYTSGDGREEMGLVLRLSDRAPVVAQSPIAQLDYVLLRLDDGVPNVRAMVPVTVARQLPFQRAGLNILQHPEGQSMKVAICSNAVTGVDHQRGLVQYVTLAKGGSSGSPCFDDEWGVVALHHAQRARAFGSIREGVLLEAIVREIGSHLND
jgi:serine/threonine protein kinase